MSQSSFAHHIAAYVQCMAMTCAMLHYKLLQLCVRICSQQCTDRTRSEGSINIHFTYATPWRNLLQRMAIVEDILRRCSAFFVFSRPLGKSSEALKSWQYRQLAKDKAAGTIVSQLSTYKMAIAKYVCNPAA